MSSETIPDAILDQAFDLSNAYPNRVEAIALALTAAEQRGRKAGLEEAAKVADTFVTIVYAHWDVTAVTPLEQKSTDGPLIAAAIRSLGEQI